VKRDRLLIFGVLGLVFTLVATLLSRWGGIEKAEFPLLFVINVIAGLVVSAIVFDTVWHAFNGKGQACRYCGHLRKMSSFRVYGNCENCGR